MDVDTLALASVKPLWDVQHKMNKSQIMAATLNDFVMNEYRYKKSVPIVPPAGKMDRFISPFSLLVSYIWFCVYI